MATLLRQRLRVGNFLRFASVTVHYVDEHIDYTYRAPGRMRTRAWELGDPDVGDFRARNTQGWKAWKHRYQWEHKVRAEEKRAKNRRKKEKV